MLLIFFELSKALTEFSEQAVEVSRCHDVLQGVYVELSNIVN